MLNKGEISAILISVIVLAFSISLINNFSTFFYAIFLISLILLINILAKKITSHYLDSKIEIGLWEIKRYGFKAHHHFKKAFPIGAFLPVISTIISLGYFIWVAVLTFDVKPRVFRAAKRHGLYTFSEITEYHIGLIAASGIFANLLFAVIGYLLGFSEFTKLNIYYAFFNMIPLSNLDGNKIFFGSLILWSFLSSLVLIGIGYILLLI